MKESHQEKTHQVSFSAKLQDGRQRKEIKVEIFQCDILYISMNLWVKNSVKSALSLAVSEIQIFWVFRQKLQKLKFFNFT